ncbi:hypothetical protein HPB48_014464 [Haemaphysalis longicornis]|uniref:Uncharacterized protein n=1 Tax=Haemaphysalis longicornis TaxID=44386 RepID=A0A9J6H2K5_HAELO|nr:hypothetical protein HPB48_014464 [Haemaphysalis longicornis]
MVLVRASHHVVHPVVCCTVKRAVRLLPSALLLVFVLSLILVTLVQIAVIHSHRRAIYLQRRLTSTYRPSPGRLQAAAVAAAGPGRQVAAPDASGSPTSNFQSWSAAHRDSLRKSNASHNRAQAAKARPNALQVEALLDRNAPTVDNNIKILTGLANAARIRDIFAGTAARTLASPSRESSSTVVSREAAGGVTQRRDDDDGVSWELVPDDVYRRAGSAAAPEDGRRTRKFVADKSTSVGTVTRPLCPEVPPGLGKFLNC